MIRLCDSAVVAIRSSASVAIETAVSKPNVMSVPGMSLSIVFGTPTTRRPFGREGERGAKRAVAADHDHGVDAVRLDRPADARVAVAVNVGVSPRRAEDRAAALEDAAHVVAVERLHVPLHEAVPAVADADDLHAVGDGRAADDGANDRVEPGAIAAGGEDA